MNLKEVLVKGEKFLRNENYRRLVLASKGWYDHLPDKEYVQMMYPLIMKKQINLENPKTFNEKIQWLKLYDHRPEYTMLVDKYKVREYIAENFGEQYLIPLLGEWDDPEEIDFAVLPEKFVLKCNHNSGLGMCICRDKSKLNIEKVRIELRKGLKEDFYLKGREWPYKNVPRKILCEKYMTDRDKTELVDYKVHNFNGIPQFILVCSNRFSEDGLHEDFYTIDWEKMPVKRPEAPTTEEIKKPLNLQRMLEISKQISAGYPFMRTDFYEINGKLYFGEITLYPASGWDEFEPDEYDMIFGNMLTLPEITQLSVPPRGV